MNKKLRRILYTAGLFAIIVAICVVCFIIGRGHTVYFDNKSIEGTNYNAYSGIDLYYKGEKVTTLGKTERISITLTGQKCPVQVVGKKTKADKGTPIDVTFELPYNMDGIVINLPAYLDGADESEYMSEFVSLATVIETDNSNDEVRQTDEFGMSVDE